MRTCCLIVLGLAAFGARAGEMAIYRCTDAAGAVTVQNMPCPKGMKQEKKMMQAITTVPMGNAATPAAHPAPARVTPTETPRAKDVPASDIPQTTSATDAPRLPPPNLFRCTTRDAGSYLTEDSEPQERCLPMRTVGFDGRAQSGDATACEVVRDTCARVPDEGLCEAWKKRHDEAEVAWRFTRPETEEKNRAEFDRVRRILAESSCAVK